MGDMHLTAEALVDLAEGTTKDVDVAHLAACASCRRQLADLRATMTLAASADVPEPPPFFWNQLSARVREAVANEPRPQRGWRRWLSWPGVMAPVSAVAAAAIVFVIVSSPRSTVVPPSSQSGSELGAPRGLSAAALELLTGSAGYDDASLELVAELTDSIGWDAAADSGLATDGSAEHAITHLSTSELQQLKRLLQEELAGKGA